MALRRQGAQCPEEVILLAAKADIVVCYANITLRLQQRRCRRYHRASQETMQKVFVEAKHTRIPLMMSLSTSIGICRICIAIVVSMLTLRRCCHRL